MEEISSPFESRRYGFMESLESKLILAVPRMPDSNFFRTVVLVIHHNDEGAFGVVLNRPSDVKLRDVWEEIAKQPCDCDLAIDLGGPVDGPLIALHTRDDCAETTVLPGIHLATQKENLNQIVNSSQGPFRIFSGYAGWGQGQLDGEMEAGGWMAADADWDHIFGEHDDLWQHVAESIGHRILSPSLNGRGMPSDPSWN